MVLVMDAGNTNIKIAVYDKDEQLASWRISSKINRTADELGIILMDLCKSIDIRLEDMEGVIIASVLPTLNYTIEHAIKYYAKKQPIMVDNTLNTGLKIVYDSPEDLGADRIATAACVYHEYGGPSIVVDFGTATTFGVISDKGDFIGGAIAIGLKTAQEALVEAGSKLYKFELVKPDNVVGKNTLDNMRSGMLYGFKNMTKGLVEQIKKETGYHNAKVVATGGLGEHIIDESWVDVYDRALSIKGLKIIYDLNREDKQ